MSTENEQRSNKAPLYEQMLKAFHAGIEYQEYHSDDPEDRAKREEPKPFAEWYNEYLKSSPLTFEEISRVMIKYLADNHHPHHTVIITSTNAELLEGQKSTGEILDYIVD